ncbi:hypothetical protein [Aromatoleum bremense]|uniref:hypothetical protein n=1 Tax=Aromatoleum bremense TaxID=76115 RepID=UPI001AEC376C|nr:hypothetical protein [Aromatoleum bremense]
MHASAPAFRFDAGAAHGDALHLALLLVQETQHFVPVVVVAGVVGERDRQPQPFAQAQAETIEGWRKRRGN